MSIKAKDMTMAERKERAVQPVMDEYNALNLSSEEKELVKPFYTSTELHKYYGNERNKLWVIYSTSKFKNKSEMKPYPHLKAHLDRFTQVITSDNKPYGLHRAREEQFLCTGTAGQSNIRFG